MRTMPSRLFSIRIRSAPREQSSFTVSVAVRSARESSRRTLLARLSRLCRPGAAGRLSRRVRPGDDRSRPAGVSGKDLDLPWIDLAWSCLNSFAS